MKNSRHHKTKLEFAEELGMSPATLYRRIRALGLQGHFSGQLLSPAEQDDLRTALDQYKEKKSSPAQESLPPPAVTQIDTD